jgi:hypothetical protein
MPGAKSWTLTDCRFLTPCSGSSSEERVASPPSAELHPALFESKMYYNFGGLVRVVESTGGDRDGGERPP